MFATGVTFSSTNRWVVGHDGVCVDFTKAEEWKWVTERHGRTDPGL